jgi:hypothetical protein
MYILIRIGLAAAGQGRRTAAMSGRNILILRATASDFRGSGTLSDD